MHWFFLTGKVGTLFASLYMYILYEIQLKWFKYWNFPPAPVIFSIITETRVPGLVAGIWAPKTINSKIFRRKKKDVKSR